MSDAMLGSELDGMVQRYLGELATALQRLPGSRRDRPVCEWDRGRQRGPVHRVRLLRHRLPVQHSEVQSIHEKSVQVHLVL